MTRKRLLLALAGLLLVLAAPFAYVAMLGDATAASTGWPAFLCSGLGVILAVAAMARDRRWRTRVPAGLAILLAGLFTTFFVFGLDMPTVTPLAQAPDFTLLDGQRRPVSLEDERMKGPVLLVFYRGFQ